MMILVDDAGGVYPRIDHSPWNGCTLADFVMPFFLFIVGVAIALALKINFDCDNVENPQDKVCCEEDNP
ncbi:heparan-alpha-glucosaminide N-acetyltransferase-like [Trifolium medium]|uniref:Heparan-alpha-glucosaminide N-acetyltransferase-like n=1 Tax=Trifolium medium TaxID=97028 RepID=A0A392PE45_9FABA|nr:heparan-alpha-glucosaminide N-acetyltransferase-like [Trifolium medium]